MSLRTTVFTSDDDKQLIAQLNDGIDLCLTRQKPYFMPFMSERKQALLLSELKKAYFDNYLFFGGYGNSERKMLGLFFDEPSESSFPISAIEFSFRKCDKLTHRDFLGSLMSLGIERETVGDILVEDGRGVVFVKTELSDYVKSQISKVGRIGVKVADADLSKLPQGRGFEEKTYIVSSLRLDNIVAAVCKLSREKTRTVIMSDSACVNFEETKNVSLNLKENDVFTIRGKGKFVLKSILGTTGKGRIRISVIHYK
nr:YlmH/Sll1252 family protein [Ruminococcus bromii]